LEIPIVFLGVAWMMVGLALLRRPAAT
jgi:hypothetical protein